METRRCQQSVVAVLGEYKAVLEFVKLRACKGLQGLCSIARTALSCSPSIQGAAATASQVGVQVSKACGEDYC